MADAELLKSSVAVHVTVVEPSWNDSGALLVISGDGSKLSIAVASPISTSVVGPVASIVRSDGAVITGGVVSVIVTV